MMDELKKGEKGKKQGRVLPKIHIVKPTNRWTNDYRKDFDKKGLVIKPPLCLSFMTLKSNISPQTKILLPGTLSIFFINSHKGIGC